MLELMIAEECGVASSLSEDEKGVLLCFEPQGDC